MKELILKKCEIECCGKHMKELSSNSVNAFFEQHVPNYKIIQENLNVNVNHVMNDDHYIKWICYVANHSEEFVYFLLNEKSCVTFVFKGNDCIYAYCNFHGLWKHEVTLS